MTVERVRLADPRQDFSVYAKHVTVKCRIRMTKKMV
jgi:hypothetical protein